MDELYIALILDKKKCPCTNELIYSKERLNKNKNIYEVGIINKDKILISVSSDSDLECSCNKKIQHTIIINITSYDYLFKDKNIFYEMTFQDAINNFNIQETNMKNKNIENIDDYIFKITKNNF
jgi:hypothetical protein